MNRPEILDTAKACVCGQREQDYGTPEDNLNKPAKASSVRTLLEVTRSIAPYLSEAEIVRVMAVYLGALERMDR